MSASEIWELLDNGGTLAFMAFLVWAVLTDRLVSGRQFRRVQNQRDKLFDLLIRSTQNTGKVANVAEELLTMRQEEEPT